MTFTCKVTGAKPAVDKYEFYFKNSNTPIAQNSNGTYQINSVKGSNQGTYKCVPHNDAGVGEEATVVLTVNGKSSVEQKNMLNILKLKISNNSRRIASRDNVLHSSFLCFKCHLLYRQYNFQIGLLFNYFICATEYFIREMYFFSFLLCLFLFLEL